MDFFEAVKRRRSIRKFKPEPFPEERILKALEAAVLAPNSSNTQTWDFHWVQRPEMKQKLVEACLSQSAARTAAELIVVTADPALWRRSQKPLVDWVEGVNAPSVVKLYYRKLIPVTYRWGYFNSWALFKWIGANFAALFRPMTRGPNTRRDLQEVAIKSAALAAENFVLAITAQGGATCMMEGFDEWRVRRLLRLPGSARVVMVIGVGFEGERGTWGPQFRLPLDQVVHRYN
jgi:nitroreductase